MKSVHADDEICRPAGFRYPRNMFSITNYGTLQESTWKQLSYTSAYERTYSRIRLAVHPPNICPPQSIPWTLPSPLGATCLNRAGLASMSCIYDTEVSNAL